MSLSPQPVSKGDFSPAWLEAWRITPTLLLETPTEQIFLANHRSMAREAWLHRVKSSQPFPGAFTKVAAQQDVPGFAPLLAWDLTDGKLIYLTLSTHSAPLAQWKLRRQMSSATTIRMRLMLQTIQTARWVIRQATPKLQLNAALATVVGGVTQDDPYRLQWHGWLPATVSDDSATLGETERILTILTAGMPWPVELSRAFHDASLPPSQRLERCEKILQSQMLNGTETVEPIQKISQRSTWLGGAMVLGLLATATVLVLKNPPSPRQAENDPKAEPGKVPSGIESVPETPAPLPPIQSPTAITVARATLESARTTTHPPTILHAAVALLELNPQDEEAHATIAKLLHDEVRHQIDFLAKPTLTSPNGWAALADAGFDDARLLMAVENWMERPTDSTNDLKAMAESGSTAATVMLGQLAAYGGGETVDLARAFDYYQKAAEQGDPGGCYFMAECLLHGKGTAADPAAAIPFLRKAADGGDVRAMDALGNRLAKGDGMERNFKEAAEWFLAAVARGYDQSLANLAVLYLNGDGVPQDFPQALTLLKRGAALDDPASLHLLGRCAETGQGMEKDFQTARDYHERAAKLGFEPSRAWLAKNLPSPADP